MSEFKFYAELKQRGLSEKACYLKAKSEDLPLMMRLRMLCVVFGLTLKEAKRIHLKADSEISLKELSEVILDAAEMADNELQRRHSQ